MTDLTKEDLDNLAHMLGIQTNTPHNNWGYRNYYAAGESDIPSMERLVVAGLVRCRGKKPQLYDDLVFYHATEEGCRVVGLNEEQIDNAMGRR